jgi:DNA-binding MarR family transcriptional regulator
MSLPTYLYYLFHQLAAQGDARFTHGLRPGGLSMTQWRSLAGVAYAGPCAMKELALFTAVDRTTLTRVVDQLVRDGLVVRSGAASDRRQVMLTVTEEGRELFRRAAAEIEVINQRALAGVPREQQRELARALAAILRNAAPSGEIADILLGGPPSVNAL